MKTIQQINKQITQLKQKLKTVQGRPCEVYTRIVGYYRPVKNWNKGQDEQRKHRLPFKVPIINQMKEKL